MTAHQAPPAWTRHILGPKRVDNRKKQINKKIKNKKQKTGSLKRQVASTATLFFFSSYIYSSSEGR